jgi:hypothetical protein
MSSPENLHSPLLISESHDEVSSSLTTIVLIPNSTSSVSVIPSLKPVDEITHENEHDSLLNKKPRYTRTNLMANLSHRLLRRQVIHKRL